MPLIDLKHADIFQSDNSFLGCPFNVNPTEFVYFIGTTGSGKSSLLKTLYAELPFKRIRRGSRSSIIRNKKSTIPFLRRKLDCFSIFSTPY